MTKNRTAQLMFQSAFCAIGIIGVIASFGFFDMVWRWDFYIQFTNISNYMCVGIMIAELIQTAKKKEDSFVTVSPALKFVGVLSILLTFIVFNFFIANESTRDPVLNYFGTGPFIYPYFFLNIDTYGVGGVCLWILGLGAVFIGVGFIFMVLDKVLSKVKTK